MQADTPELCVVQTTLATEAQAAELARAVVRARLGACVQLQAIRSVYVWQEQVRDEPEWLLSIKTRRTRYPQLQAWLREHHPYDTPEIVCLPVHQASPDYATWVATNTGEA
ncbi:MAG: divalent-cation tolerance protein CutA [Curvibacter sp.]